MFLVIKIITKNKKTYSINILYIHSNDLHNAFNALKKKQGLILDLLCYARNQRRMPSFQNNHRDVHFEIISTEEKENGETKDKKTTIVFDATHYF